MQIKLFVENSSFPLFYRKYYHNDPNDVLEDAINHENASHLCNYFGNECPFKGIKYMEKVELNLLSTLRFDKNYN